MQLKSKRIMCNPSESAPKKQKVNEKAPNDLAFFPGHLSILSNALGEHLFGNYLDGEDQSNLFMLNKTIKESFSNKYNFNLKIARAIQFVFKDTKLLTPFEMVEIFKSPTIHPSLKLVYGHVNNRLNFLKQDNIKLEPELKEHLIWILQNAVTQSSQERELLNKSLSQAIGLINEREIIQLIEKGADIYLENSLDLTIFHQILKNYNFSKNLIRKLIDFGFDVNYSSAKSHSPLILTILSNHSAKEFVLLLIEAGARVNPCMTKEYPFFTPLQAACKKGKLDVVCLLLEQGAHTHVKNKNGNSILHHAICSAEIPVIGTILENEGLEGINEKDCHGETALHIAVRHGFHGEIIRYRVFGQPDVVQFLLNNGADIKAVDNLGQTALHLAAKVSNFEIIKLLVNSGANILARDKKGNTPFMVLMDAYFEYDDISIVKFLGKRNRDMSLKNNEGNTLLHLATRSPNGRILIPYLLSMGADVSVKNYRGNTPLHFAAGKRKLYHTSSLRNEDDTIINLLVKSGSDIHARNIYGETPLYFAVREDNLNFVQLLKQNGAESNTCNRDGETPLHYAAGLTRFHTSGHMLKFLLEMTPSSVQVQNLYGETPYQIALRYNAEAAKEFEPYVAENHVSSKFHPSLNPFHRAIRENTFEVVDEFLNRSNFTDEKDCFGKNAIWHAACVGNIELILSLLEKGIEMDSCALHAASSFGHDHVVEFLLHNGFNIDVQDAMGQTAFHHAIHHRQYKMAVFLIENGINVSLKDKNSQDAFYCKRSDSDVEQIYNAYRQKKTP